MDAFAAYVRSLPPHTVDGNMVCVTDGESRYSLDTTTAERFYQLYMDYLIEGRLNKISVWSHTKTNTFDLRINLEAYDVPLRHKSLERLFNLVTDCLPYSSETYSDYFFLFYTIDKTTLGIMSPNLLMTVTEIAHIQMCLVEKLGSDGDDPDELKEIIKLNGSFFRVIPGCKCRVGDDEYKTNLVNCTGRICYKDGTYKRLFSSNFCNAQSAEKHYLLSTAYIAEPQAYQADNMIGIQKSLFVSTQHDACFNFIPHFELRKIKLIPQLREDKLFESCKMSTGNSLTYQALLDCLAPSRFVLDTVEGIQSAVNIIMAIDQCIPHDVERTRTRAIAMSQFIDLARRKTNSDPDMNAVTAILSHKVNKRKLVSMRTLMYYARIDNERYFTTIMGTYIWEQLLSIKSEKNYIPLAKGLAMAMQPYYIAKGYKSSGANKIALYEYKGPHYIYHMEGDTHIRYLMGNGGYLIRVLDSYTKALHARAAKTTIEKSKDIQTSLRVIDAIATKLGEPKYRDNVIRELLLNLQHIQRELAFDENIDMDADVDLFGVNNGVLEVCIDVQGKELLYFREGMPDDRLTKRSTANYNPDVVKAKTYKRVKTYFKQLFPQDDVRHWLLSWIASGFRGKNPKIACFIIGPTDAGKSTFGNFLQGAFGDDYSGPTVTELFNDPRLGTDAPVPAIVKALSDRLTIMEETSQLIKAGPFKNLNGGPAKTRARGMHVSGGTVTNTTRFLGLLNSFVGFDHLDLAIQRRTAIVQTEARFVDPKSRVLPATDEERWRLQIFPKDESFVDKLNLYSDALLFYLTKFYGLYPALQEVPPEITKWTRRVFNEADKMMKYRLNYMYEVPWGKIRITDLYATMNKNKVFHGNMSLENFQQKFQKMFSPKLAVTTKGIGCWLGLWMSEVNIYKDQPLFEFIVKTVERERGAELDLEDLFNKYAESDDYEYFAEMVRSLLSGTINDEGTAILDFRLI